MRPISIEKLDVEPDVIVVVSGVRADKSVEEGDRTEELLVSDLEVCVDGSLMKNAARETIVSNIFTCPSNAGSIEEPSDEGSVVEFQIMATRL